MSKDTTCLCVAGAITVITLIIIAYDVGRTIGRFEGLGFYVPPIQNVFATTDKKV